jgi:uncharacterized protein
MPEIIDSCVHPMVRQSDELREHMPEPWRSRPIPGPERYYYPSPDGEFWPDAVQAGSLPGSDPELLAKHLFKQSGIDRAVLVPLTRGLAPEIDLGSAICSGTNKWLAETWLGKGNPDGRFLGSIRINPSDPVSAVREIETWSDHPAMVQVAVPLEAHAPYGRRQYAPIWAAAEKAGLPVAVHSEGGSGADFFPTPVGFPRHYCEYATLMPLNYVYHLSSLIADGVFERHPDLKFIFADGAASTMWPLIWRLDCCWRIERNQTPWVPRLPTRYLVDHVRFCTDSMDMPPSEATTTGWFELDRTADLQLYASNYPHWTFLTPEETYPREPAEFRERVLGANAQALYRRRLPARRPSDG